MSRRITKVKSKGSTIEIHLVELQGKDEKDSIFKSTEKPSPEFDMALQSLVPAVYKILQLPRDWRTGSMQIGGVSFSMSEETGVEGAVITGRVGLDTCNAPFNFNTPHLPFDQYSAGGDSPTMDGGSIDLLAKVRDAAAAYLDGKRAQQELALA